MSLAAKHFVWRASCGVCAANSERRRVLEQEMAGYSSESVLAVFVQERARARCAPSTTFGRDQARIVTRHTLN